ncbi:MAG: hypothetical protein WDA03_10285 [Trueperaceae bacterium]
MGGERFDYRITKDGVVRVFWEGRCVTVVKGAKGQALAASLQAADDTRTQALLQRVTGNFKRGNERLVKSARR